MPVHVTVALGLTLAWVLAEFDPRWAFSRQVVIEDHSLSSMENRALGLMAEGYEIRRSAHVVGWTVQRFRVVLDPPKTK